MTTWISNNAKREEVFAYLEHRPDEALAKICRHLRGLKEPGGDYKAIRAGSREAMLDQLRRAKVPDLRKSIFDSFSRVDAKTCNPPWRAPCVPPGPDGNSKHHQSPTFRLYEIELHPTCRTSHAVKRDNDALQNPDFKAKGFIYVGSTKHTADYRFWQHCVGKEVEETACPLVTMYGVQLITPIELHITNRTEAQRRERDHAIDLRKQGYVVYQK
jgi:hypothetical protein